MEVLVCYDAAASLVAALLAAMMFKHKRPIVGTVFAWFAAAMFVLAVLALGLSIYGKMI
jgi:hypothetical protein